MILTFQRYVLEGGGVGTLCLFDEAAMVWTMDEGSTG
jgi:hypothetical protein